MSEENPKLAIFDLECDGLNPTKIYCLVAKVYLNGNWVDKTLTEYEDMRKLFEWSDIVIGHNIIRFDIPVAERILDIKIDAELIDTLALSWYLYPEPVRDKHKHGLADWGEDFGIPKPEIDDWENLPLEEYIHRCQEDVKITYDLYFKELKYLKKIYQSYGNYRDLMRYLSFKMHCAMLQEKSGWKLDLDKVNKYYDMFLSHIERVEAELVDAMPMNKKMGKMNRPKQRYKKDGEETVVWKRWADRVREQGFDPETYEEDTIPYLQKLEEPNINSTQQKKDWLFSLGWEPATFDYKKDKTKKSGWRKIPQIKDGDDICESVKKLIPKEPAVELLSDLSVATHRKNILKNFLSDCDEDGYIQAQVSGFTNTLRFRHMTLVNLPKVNHTGDFSDGIYIRGCLIAEDGYELCGSDMSSLEDRTKQHFIYPYDPQYVEDMQTPGYDPHLDIGIRGGILTKEEADWYKEIKRRLEEEDGFSLSREQQDKFNEIDAKRSNSKTVNYASTYGAGAKKLSLTTDMTFEEAKVLRDGYWKRNWAVKQIAKDATVQTIDGQMWLWNPVANLWYSLKNDKDIFSTLNQGTGSFCFDTWIGFILSKREQITGQFHDEGAWQIKKGYRKECKELLQWAINKTNKVLNLSINLGIDVHFGDSYAEIH